MIEVLAYASLVFLTSVGAVSVCRYVFGRIFEHKSKSWRSRYHVWILRRLDAALQSDESLRPSGSHQSSSSAFPSHANVIQSTAAIDGRPPDDGRAADEWFAIEPPSWAIDQKAPGAESTERDA